MISSSVPDLDAKSVTLVDQRGNLLSAAHTGARGLDVSQLKYSQEIEQGYIRRIEAILQPIVGASNVRAQVAADIDFSVVEHTDEKYRPNQEPGSAAIRSQQSSESTQPGGAPPGGVPGALSNQPPANPIAPITIASPASAASAPLPPATATATVSARKDGTTNYELDRSIRHVQQGVGSIKRLSAAVVVNHREVTDGKGKTSARALTPTEIEQIINLAKEAMGFSEDRGDSLNVVNSLFASDVQPAEPEVPFWRQRDNIEIGKTLGQYLLYAVLALFVWRVVLRPLLRKHLIPSATGVASRAQTRASVPDEEVEVEVEVEEEESPAEKPARLRAAERQKANVGYAHQSADKDPRLVATLVQHWMGRS